jgi:hypothetical protein
LITVPHKADIWVGSGFLQVRIYCFYPEYLTDSDIVVFLKKGHN